jgi:uncharacterized protein YecT (DUF1311 family)
MRYIFFLLLFNLSVKGQTTLELRVQTCGEYSQVDDKLNKVYQKILSLYEIDTLFIQKLRVAQNNWIKLRDADMEMYMLDGVNYGSVRSICRCDFLKELTEARIKFLNKWVVGDREEGEICGGTTRMLGQSDEDFKKALKFEVKYMRD